MTVSTPKDPCAFLSSFDTIVVIDDSGSMAGSSWPEVKNVLSAITPICTTHKKDGVNFYFLNHKTWYSGNVRAGKAGGGYHGICLAETVHNIFTKIHPYCTIPTGQRFNDILRSYLQLLKSRKQNTQSVKPINIIVITDGAASDDVESIIITAAEKPDKLNAPKHQVGNKPGARETLQELDDDLARKDTGKLRDLVDTITWDQDNRDVLTADRILKGVLGAVLRRLDRRRWRRGCRRTMVDRLRLRQSHNVASIF
ncbi:von Willebrand factor [Colletotrichum tofieldiae]|uniref:von willebrand factor n=1 Tax=Colletotrichum tofieldiae TaxID=708197 RepID=A0A166NH37_9PEZI|nr:von willebrand factor [Colletotrichum tofieldiae]GKT67202.1 von Willebrand factor [Colletotrichum tofieldiae]GKT81168.1 von Willebrand factor [Colletotrichum tofieldiae]GKT97320.1 von willebrand factor [Colletotrichum tofieldiae]